MATAFYLNQRSVRSMATCPPRAREARAAHQRRRGLMDDIELLRAFEPVVRFTDGEHFFPMAAESYVGACDLLGARAGGDR